MRYRYYLSGGNLIKGKIAPTGSPPVYNTANESTTTVLYTASAASTSLFFYYDGTFNGTTSTQPLAQPVNITKISYVQIGLNAQLNEIRNSTTTFSIITGASVRNLKTNLGN
jgi:sulfur relay (sulfurtransferase) complex TusBCD TusD component (DsrE family)